jgi:hypothetical protein
MLCKDSTREYDVQPNELVAIMAAIIYSGHRETEAARPETRQSAVEEAWHLWHLTMDAWSDPGVRPFEDTKLGS